MTRGANARLAGSMFLLYIATGVASLVLFQKASGAAGGAAAQLASLARHASMVRLAALLTWLTFVDAVALAVALYALTRDQDRDLALLALCCRVGEGVVGAVAAVRTLQLLSVAAASTAAGPEAAAATALGAILLQTGGASALVGASCFAVGSTLYAYLFLRARSIPASLAWLGVLASLLLLVGLPMRMVDLVRGPAAYFIWIPMAVFELAFAFWLLTKGVAASRLSSRETGPA